MMDDRSTEVLAAETKRCAAIRAQDYGRLTTLLHPSLIHVHTRGNEDTRDSYLKYLAEVVEILDVRRGALKVAVYGSSAVMTGRQFNTARARGADLTITVEAQVMQVWVLEGRAWRMVAFQATSIGAPPPPFQPAGLSK